MISISYNTLGALTRDLCEKRIFLGLYHSKQNFKKQDSSKNDKNYPKKQLKLQRSWIEKT